MSYDIVDVIEAGDEDQRKDVNDKIQHAECEHGPYFPIWPKSVRQEIVYAWLLAHDANLKDTLTGNIRLLKDYEPIVLDDVRHIELYKSVRLLVSPDGTIYFESTADIIQQREGLQKSLYATNAISQAEGVAQKLYESPVIERALKCAMYAPARTYYSTVREILWKLMSKHPNLDDGIKVTELEPGFSMALMELALNYVCGPGLHVASRYVARYSYGLGVPRGNRIIIKVNVTMDNILHVSGYDVNGMGSASDKLRVAAMSIPRRCIETMYHYHNPPYSMSKEQYDSIIKEWGCVKRHQTLET